MSGRQIEDLGPQLMVALRLQADPYAAVDRLGRVIGHAGKAAESLHHTVSGGLHRVAGDVAAGVHQFGHRSVRGNGSPRDDQQAVAGGFDLLHDVGAENHGALAAERTDQLPDLDALVGIEPFGGLVEHQDLGLVEDRPGHARPLAVPLRDLADGPEEDVFQPCLLGRPADSRASFRVVEAAQPGDVFEELAHQHVLVERVRFRQVPHARLRRREVVGNRLAIEANRALVGLERPRQHAHRGRLPGPVGSQETDDLAPVHVEGGPVDRHNGSVALGHAFHRDHSSSCVGPTRKPRRPLWLTRWIRLREWKPQPDPVPSAHRLFSRMDSRLSPCGCPVDRALRTEGCRAPMRRGPSLVCRGFASHIVRVAEYTILLPPCDRLPLSAAV